MAGGIDWFRWHHGSVIDPKFGLVAKRANARRGDVVAIWAYLLEQASQSADRGTVGAIDCDSIDLMLDCDEGTTAAVLQEFAARGMTVVTLRDTQHVTLIAKWDERQPKREDETAAERKRRQREREHELAIAAGVTRSASRDVTQKAGDVTQEKPDVTHGHDRGEESREEKNSPSLRSGERGRKRPPAVAVSSLVEAGFSEPLAQEFIDHKDRMKAPLTARAWADHCREAQKAGWSPSEAAEKTIARSWKGFESRYVANERPPTRAAPMSYAQADSEAKAARIYEMTGGLMGKKPDHIEVIDAPLKAIR
jgi:hypothetical protein